jgi:hypothetical protein
MNNFWEIQIEKTYFRCQSLFLLGTTRIGKKLTGHYCLRKQYISIDINLHLQKMKKIYLLLICFLLFTNRGFGQTNFESESDVLTYLDGKTFYSTDQSVKVKIGYSSTLGTYGFILNGTASHFNLTIVILSPTRAVITGESLSDPDGKMKIRINSTTDCVENEGSYYCVKK